MTDEHDHRPTCGDHPPDELSAALAGAGTLREQLVAGAAVAARRIADRLVREYRVGLDDHSDDTLRADVAGYGRTLRDYVTAAAVTMFREYVETEGWLRPELSDDELRAIAELRRASVSARPPALRERVTDDDWRAYTEQIRADDTPDGGG